MENRLTWRLGFIQNWKMFYSTRKMKQYSFIFFHNSCQVMFDLESLPERSESVRNERKFFWKDISFLAQQYWLLAEYPKAEENSFVLIYCWFLCCHFLHPQSPSFFINRMENSILHWLKTYEEHVGFGLTLMKPTI